MIMCDPGENEPYNIEVSSSILTHGSVKSTSLRSCWQANAPTNVSKSTDLIFCFENVLRTTFVRKDRWELELEENVFERLASIGVCIQRPSCGRMSVLSGLEDGRALR